MLEELNKVDWIHLTHAYGTAEDVPALLRALASSDKEQRENAITEAFGNIWHQGTVYEATAYAVPFLIELATCESVQDRHAIVRLLAEISRGRSYWAVHKDTIAGLSRAPAEIEQKLAREQQWVERAHGAVAQAIPACEGFLVHPEPEMRIAAAILLGTFPERAGEIRPVGWKRMSVEPESRVRASLLAMLRSLGVSVAEDLPRLKMVFHEETDRLVRLLAALMILAAEAERAPDAIVDEILWALRNVLALDDAWSEVSWSGSCLESDAVEVLCHAGKTRAERIAPLLIGRFHPQVVDFDCWLPRMLMLLVFGVAAVSRPPVLRELTPVQVAVLREFVERSYVWRYGAKSPTRMEQLMSDYRLPTTQASLASFLDGIGR